MTMHRRTLRARSFAATATLSIAALLATIPSVSAQAPAADGPGTSEASPKPAKSTAVDGAQNVSATAVSADAARQAKLVADTARLYKLAQELKIEVDKSSKDTMSLAVIKKAAEVEELARDLKERLKMAPPKSK
jgi:hypothetical protein